MATFHTVVGKVRYSGNRRFIAVGPRVPGYETKDGQDAFVIRRSDSRATAEKAARNFGRRAVVVDTVAEANGQKLGR